MRPQKLLCICIAILALNFNSLAIVPSSSFLKNESIDNTTHLSAKDQLRIAQMKQFVKMTPAEYGKFRGKKLNFFERMTFKLSQHRMKQMLKQYDYGDGPSTLTKISWLVKGLLFGPIALILGYIFLKDDDRVLIKWIWFGFIGFAAIVAVLLFSL